MRSFCHLALVALPWLVRVAAEEPASPSPTKQTENVVKAIYANANEAFQDLLNALPEESLHVALNSLTHFRDGVFESDRRGVEHIHQDNPPLATKLIVAAVQDLKKRQQPASSNGTVPTTQSQEPQSTNPPESSQAPESSQPPESSQAPESSQNTPVTTQAPPAESSSAPQSSAVLVPVPVQTTTDAEGRSTVVSSDILSRPTASVVIPVTRTNADGSTEVTTETKPAVIFSTTDSAGAPVLTTSTVDFAPTKGQVLTTTNAEGSTFLTTYTPGSGRVSSIVLITTTGANGQQSVVTSYTYVDPAAAATGTGSDGPGSTAKPSLQRGMAPRYRAVDAAVLGGLFGGALAIFA